GSSTGSNKSDSVKDFVEIESEPDIKEVDANGDMPNKQHLLNGGGVGGGGFDCGSPYLLEDRSCIDAM
ncbi:unnamed protein product, partial [Soboliphyme baturini]|uniref:Bravo_FIGEY domain-containing protein n=1 Tax=Soboliphyme baturini TaxID=241478 RepID=A0A183J0U5_9BILA